MFTLSGIEFIYVQNALYIGFHIISIFIGMQKKYSVIITTAD